MKNKILKLLLLVGFFVTGDCFCMNLAYETVEFEMGGRSYSCFISGTKDDFEKSLEFLGPAIAASNEVLGEVADLSTLTKGAIAYLKCAPKAVSAAVGVLEENGFEDEYFAKQYAPVKYPNLKLFAAKVFGLCNTRSISFFTDIWSPNFAKGALQVTAGWIVLDSVRVYRTLKGLLSHFRDTKKIGVATLEKHRLANINKLAKDYHISSEEILTSSVSIHNKKGPMENLWAVFYDGSSTTEDLVEAMQDFATATGM